MSCSRATQQSEPIVKWLISKGHLPPRMAFKMHNRPKGEKMENTTTQRRAIGLLVLFATVLAVMAAWNLPERE
jgi:hypothetical protein